MYFIHIVAYIPVTEQRMSILTETTRKQSEMRKDRPRSEVLIAVFPEIQVFWDVKLR